MPLLETSSGPLVSENGMLSSVRLVANHAFSRAAGAPLLSGNHVEILRDARENYPAWIEAIEQARRHVHFENYIIADDVAGAALADALVRKAQEGVSVRLIYDWFGSYWKASRAYWNHLRENGVDVRCFNPPRLESPFGWISRDHRKMLTVDGEVAFITGLCVGRDWMGDPEKGIEPWRDTGVRMRGPAVADVERAFAQMWELTGDPLPDEPVSEREEIEEAGTMRVRIVAGVPATAGMFRLDQLIASMARKRLWLSDAYFVATSAYVQALRAAAVDGVDVRLLLPNATDLPFIRPLSRAGYRPLLKAGVRVFEWNGPMMHAKTAVADGVWARVGSTNLNVASWMGNCELDAVVEDPDFGAQMEAMYLEDLEHATEVVLDAHFRPRSPHVRAHHGPHGRRSRGSVGRAAAGAIRISSTVGAAFTDRRTLEPIEARLISLSGIILIALAVLWWFFPAVLVYPVIAFSVWFGATLVWRGVKLYRKRRARNR